MPIKILIIDDDPAMTELLKILLSSHGFDILTANSAEEGLTLARVEMPNLVITDLMMPDVDGWQTAQAIKSFSSAPLMVLSALDSPAHVARALDAGADDYLVKPVPSSVLIAHINTLTRRAAAEVSGLSMRQSSANYAFANISGAAK